uniref:Uncharacterized protein n=1 Tax=Amphimedon queenslandica TaxID=400682 RepID=A0A1X7UER1_AMPQE
MLYNHNIVVLHYVLRTLVQYQTIFIQILKIFNVVILQRGVLGKVEQYHIKKNIKCVEHLITSSNGLKMLPLLVLIVQIKSVLSYKIELPVI